MPSLGPAEILVVLVVALLVFGPNKMPEIAPSSRPGVREFRRVQEHLTSELQNAVRPGPHGPAPSSGGDPVPTPPWTDRHPAAHRPGRPGPDTPAGTPPPAPPGPRRPVPPRRWARPRSADLGARR